MTGRPPPDTGPDSGASDPLALLGHELRTPLNAIIGFAEMLDGEVLGDVGNDRYREYARHIRESGTQLRDLISDVLMVLADHGGTSLPQPAAIDPAGVVQSCLERVRFAASRAKIGLASAGNCGNVRLHADRESVTKILAALARDAIDGGRVGDRVTVSCTVAARRRTLTYRIERLAPPDRPAISVQPADTPDLAPAIWHWMVRLNGGKLALDRRPGAGWLACVTFPGHLLRANRESAAEG